MRIVISVLVIFISLAILLAVGSTDDKGKQLDKIEKFRTIAEFKDSSGWTTTVYFLNLSDWLPLPGTTTNGGYMLYQGGWNYEILYGSAHGQTTLETYFVDIDKDGIDEIIVKFNDEVGFNGEVNRISVDSLDRIHHQLLHFPGVGWPMDATALDFDPLEIKADSVLTWKMGPNAGDTIYQVKYSLEGDSLVLISVFP